jgi:hypothetical protein
MSFYTFEDNFDDGSFDTGVLGTQADTASQMTFPHYSVLARKGLTPYRGSYCMELKPVGSTTAHLTNGETGEPAIALAETNYFAFALMVGSDWEAGGTSTTYIAEFQGAADEREAAIGIRWQTTGVVNWVLEVEPAGGTTTINTSQPIELDVWYWVELILAPADGTGVMTMQVTKEGNPRETTALITDSGITSVAIDDLLFGMNNQGSTQRGSIYLDAMTFHATSAITAPTLLWHSQTNRIITKDLHAFIGPGIIENVSLQAGNGTDCVATIYDTNTGETDVALTVARLQNTIENETVDTSQAPVKVQRGAYVVMSGTTPRLNITCRPRYIGRAQVIQHGLQGDH